MGKIVFWIVVFFVVLLGLRLLNLAKTRESARKREDRKPAPELPAEPTVRCEQCGVFLPKSEAQATATGYRCGDPGCSRRR
jgi:preprotein translocase subunit SecG